MSDYNTTEPASNEADAPQVRPIHPHEMGLALCRRWRDTGSLDGEARIGTRPVTVSAAIAALAGDQTRAPDEAIEALGLGNSTATWSEIGWALKDRHERAQRAAAAAEAAAADWRLNHPGFADD